MTTNIAHLACVFAAIVILSFFFKPFRFLLRGIFRSVLGFLSLFLINIAGGYVGIGVGVNIINGIFVGLLGIPGVATLLAIQKIIM